jgi:hypothetical protein
MKCCRKFVWAMILPSEGKRSSIGVWKVVERNFARVHLGVITHGFHDRVVGSKWRSELEEIHHCCVSLFSLPHISIYVAYLVLRLLSTWLCVFVTVVSVWKPTKLYRNLGCWVCHLGWFDRQTRPSQLVILTRPALAEAYILTMF